MKAWGRVSAETSDTSYGVRVPALHFAGLAKQLQTINLDEEPRRQRYLDAMKRIRLLNIDLKPEARGFPLPTTSRADFD